MVSIWRMAKDEGRKADDRNCDEAIYIGEGKGILCYVYFRMHTVEYCIFSYAFSAGRLFYGEKKRNDH